jgi:ABC-type uncharacterized transport system permease subunit
LRLNIQKLIPLLSLILAVLIGAVVIAVCGYSPLTAYRHLLSGAFGSLDAIKNTLDKTTPLIFCGLAVAIALKAGMFNIGAEGQLYMGAMVYALCGAYIQGLPPFLHVVLGSILAMIAGGLWAFIPAVLKIKRGAHEVVTTIMLNYIAILFTGYLVTYPFKAPGIIPATVPILKTAKIFEVFPGSQVSWTLLMALLVSALIYFGLKYMRIGYEITATGINPKAAEAGGIEPNIMRLVAMLISGGLAGLSGGMLIASTYGKFFMNFSPGYGFDGIAIAVLGLSSPGGIIIASIFFGALRAGSLDMDMFAKIPSELISLLQGIMILIISAPAIFNLLLTKWRPGRNEQ